VARVVSLELRGLAGGVEECWCIGSANSFIQTDHLKEQRGGCRVSDVEDLIEGSHHGDQLKSRSLSSLRSNGVGNRAKMDHLLAASPHPDRRRDFRCHVRRKTPRTSGLAANPRANHHTCVSCSPSRIRPRPSSGKFQNARILDNLPERKSHAACRKRLKTVTGRQY
jgi:hypothetical protein